MGEDLPAEAAAPRETPAQKYFRYRGWTPVPLYVALLILPWWRDKHWIACWASGLGVVALGALLRLWAIRHIGRSARTRTEKTRPLVATGPYAAIRNPLYVANILIAAGFAIASQLLWYAPILAVLLFIHYHIVILCEERGLKTRHGEDYLSYFRAVPRWFPRRLGADVWMPAPNPLGQALYRELSGIFGLLLASAVLAAGTWWWRFRS